MNGDTPHVLKLLILLLFSSQASEVQDKSSRLWSPRLIRSFGMCSSLVLLCNSWSFVIDLTYSYLYSHDLYPAVSDIYFMIRQLVLVHWYPFQYSKVCSSMMFVHPKGGVSARDTRVSLINVDMVSGLIKCCWISPFPTVCRGSLQVVTALFCAIVILHDRSEGQEVHKVP